MITDTRAYAEQHGVGLLEAKRAVTRANKIERLEMLRARCRRARSTESVASILADVIEELIEDAKA